MKLSRFFAHFGIKLIRCFLGVFYKLFRRSPDEPILNIQRFNSVIHTVALFLMGYGDDGTFWNSGETKVMSYVKNQLNKKYPQIIFYLFDVGANKGEYSLEIAKCFDNNVVIHAFEPIDTTYKRLLENTKDHSTTIHAHNVGLSNEPAFIPMFTTEEEGSELSSIYQGHGELYIKKECKFTSVDIFCKTFKIDHIHFLKIDVEGHELAVLRGAKNMLKERRIDYIQFEFGVAHIEAKSFFFDFWRLLSDDYQIYRIVSGGLIPLNRYAEQMEIFLYSNYLAELKSF